ncbi:HlyD family efflux transporter periplasmic adaptor subunit [Undibacterium sp.]|uniref:HlyD family secretion protein n=1 Tax=Undibacterium sp. TaxID=1914977 RepID=UPI0025EDD85C|nr:HlyD family efflux transporter periplasmic adaptor subunit [Undibacterium sp.]
MTQHSTTNLFRPEVSARQSQQYLGSIRLAQAVSGWLIAAVASLIAIALISFVSLGSVSKKARVTGITLPVGGSISISAPNAGLLLRSHVLEGQSVLAGQALFELSTERQGYQGEITALVAQQLASRQQSLEAEQRLRNAQTADKKQALALRISNLSTEAAQLEQEISLSLRRHALAQESLTKYLTLQGNGYVSAAQTQQKQEELIDIASRLSNLQRNKLQLQANQLALQAEHSALANSLATDQAQLQRASASLQQEIAENHNRKTSQITASQAGTITTLSSQTGQSINAGQVLATLIPGNPASSDKHGTDNSQLEAHLYAPSRSAGFVAIGQSVLIRYQAYPYQKFGLQKGRVSAISKTPFAPNELPANLASTILSNAQQNIQGFNSNEALYRVKVTLEKQTIDAYGQAQSLKPGMTLEADILQDRRRIWEWIIEPVLAVSQSL